jgi:nickel/cobalt transporter (NiCoT) family protein
VERLRTLGMYGSILALHALGFAVFIACVLPAHYKLFSVGLPVTAYTLGLRHAFDADHISAARMKAGQSPALPADES